jgi:hypothetical protein
MVCADHDSRQGTHFLHVLGHWLGLVHTSHTAGGISMVCNDTQPGDYVSDTPYQALMNTLECEARLDRMILLHMNQGHQLMFGVDICYRSLLLLQTV